MYPVHSGYSQKRATQYGTSVVTKPCLFRPFPQYIRFLNISSGDALNFLSGKYSDRYVYPIVPGWYLKSAPAITCTNFSIAVMIILNLMFEPLSLLRRNVSLMLRVYKAIGLVQPVSFEFCASENRFRLCV